MAIKAPPPASANPSERELSTSPPNETKPSLDVNARVGAGHEDAEEPVPAPTSGDRQTAPAVAYDIMLGVTGESPQYGLLGDVSGRRVAIDLNQTHTLSLFGVQGGGKSYTLGTIAEMASLPIPHINVLPQPLATVIFHYSPTMDYRPEFTSMVSPNTDAAQVKALKDRAARTVGCSPLCARRQAGRAKARVSRS